MAIYEAVIILVIFVLFVILLLYLLRRFVWIPIKISLQRRNILRKYRNHRLKDEHLVWCNEKYDKGWSYLDVRKNAFLFFSKIEIPEVLYTFMKIQEAKQSKGGEK